MRLCDCVGSSQFTCDEVAPAPVASRFACRNCGNPTLQHPRAGRPRSYCDADNCQAAKRREKRSKSCLYKQNYTPIIQLVETNCIECGKSISYLRGTARKRRSVCPGKCAKDRKDRSKDRNRHKYLERARARERRKDATGICANVKCNKPFTCARSNKHKQKYCSPECHWAVDTERKRSEGFAKRAKICAAPHCGRLFLPSRPNADQRRRGHVQEYCSRECRKGLAPSNVIVFRSNNRPSKLVPVNPLDILRRDKWKCHLCGIKCPKRLRGTTDDRAPEVDHIVPASKGGTNDPSNLACACRRCNRHKGAAEIGQLRLFG